MFKLTNIVATIGPTSHDIAILESLIHAGVNIVRMNFSHGDHEYHGWTINAARELSTKLNRHIGVLLDTKGPEIRTGKLVDGNPIQLVAGQQIIVTTQEILGDTTQIAISYRELCQDVVIWWLIMIADGLICLEITKINTDHVVCMIRNGWTLGEKKNVNLPGVKVSLPAMSEQDRKDLLFGCQQQVDFIAASFIRKASDVREIRDFLTANGGKYIKIISKIENQEGIDNFEEILAETDGVMVARGDLWVDIPLHHVPLAQKMMIRTCHQAGKPVITATQMLESMIQNPRPTRAEVTDIANAVLDGTDAVMLSGETAGGKYPVEAVSVMTDVICKAESEYTIFGGYKDSILTNSDDLTSAVAKGAVQTAQAVGATLIIAASVAGTTVRALRKHDPMQPILVLTNHIETARQISLVRWAQAVLVDPINSYENLYTIAIHEAKKRWLVSTWDLVVIVGGGSIGAVGVTDSMKVVKVN